MAEIAVSLGEYELEEPWGRLVEVGRATLTVDFHLPGPVTTYVLKDRTTRASSFICKSIEDAVALARFLDAHLAELRRFLLEHVERDHARLRGLETDVTGRSCDVTWSFSTGDLDPDRATERALAALHEGFLARLAPVPLEETTLEPGLGGGIGVLAASGEKILRIDVREPSGPAYRSAQLTAARQLA